ncbi:hypothetical protein HDU76_007515 [Blyttiomyces sp. JEL0837]|nr:hypothetical protein HDU76_007515 [Blyttiomyces sp. JEL0837]
MDEQESSSSTNSPQQASHPQQQQQQPNKKKKKAPYARRKQPMNGVSKRVSTPKKKRQQTSQQPTQQSTQQTSQQQSEQTSSTDDAELEIVTVVITKEMENHAYAEMARIMAQHQLEFDEKLPLTGNKKLADHSSRAYTTHFKGITSFCILTGDYTSLIPLQEREVIPICPSVNAKTIALYLRWKQGKPNTPLLHPSGEPVFDTAGKPIKCIGGWNDPKIMNQFLSAMTRLHKSRKQTSAYQDDCKLCIRDGKGCHEHSQKAFLFPRGNPRNSEDVQNTVHDITIDKGDYEENGDKPLLPPEMMAIRQKLLSSNDKKDLQMWVMILLAIKLFLRADEVLNLTFDGDTHGFNRVDWNLTTIHESGMIKGLTFKVSGKSENRLINGKATAKYVNLTGWFDDDHAEMCPVRALLIYLHVCKPQGKYLFPADLDPNHPKHEEPMPYDQFNIRFQAICQELLPRAKFDRFGTHTCRKTAYLLAILGGGVESDICQSARHADMNTALRYIKDTRYIIATAVENKVDLYQHISQWKTVRCLSENIAKSLIRRHHEEMTLTMAADIFVVKLLKIDENHPQRSIPFIFAAAEGYKDLDPQKEIATLLAAVSKHDANLSSQLQEAMSKMERLSWCLVSKVRCKCSLVEAREKLTNTQVSEPKHKKSAPIPTTTKSAPASTTTTGNMLTDPPPTAAATSNRNSESMNAALIVPDLDGVEVPKGTKRKRDRSEGYSLTKRRDVQKLPTWGSKVNLLLEIREDMRANVKCKEELDGGSKQFAYQMDDVLNCFENHFNKDLVAFDNKWGGVCKGVSLFGTKCCFARGFNCGDTKKGSGGVGVTNDV